MGFFKRLFGKKEEVVVEEIVEVKEPEFKAEQYCDYCEEGLYPGQPRKKFSNNVYHKKCFRKLKKQAKKQVFG